MIGCPWVRINQSKPSTLPPIREYVLMIRNGDMESREFVKFFDACYMRAVVDRKGYTHWREERTTDAPGGADMSAAWASRKIYRRKR